MKWNGVQAALVTVIVYLLSGCGTINTVARTDTVAKRKLNNYGTYCESIPRVYSGVSFDFCCLHGKPNPEATVQAGFAIPAIALDAVLSFALDTVALPYTIYRQTMDGSIDIK